MRQNEIEKWILREMDRKIYQKPTCLIEWEGKPSNYDFLFFVFSLVFSFSRVFKLQEFYSVSILKMEVSLLFQGKQAKN